MGSDNLSADDQSNIQQESRENAKNDGRIAHKIEETISSRRKTKGAPLSACPLAR